jgi:ubiquitin-conjugating enzyme E2 M
VLELRPPASFFYLWNAVCCALLHNAAHLCTCTPADAWHSKKAPGLALTCSLCLHADVSELKVEKGLKIDFYNGKEDLMNFKIEVYPDDGIYRGGKFIFDVKVPKAYPHEPPKVLCETTVFHPNIDMEGHVCLNILREDWKPVLTISSVIMGLQFLMLEPNADDPLNKEVGGRAQPRAAHAAP